MLLLDGYNLLFTGGWLPVKPNEEDIRRAREALLIRLTEYRRHKPETITVVFDAQKPPVAAGPRRQRVQGIDVVFAPEGMDADAAILAILDQAKNPGMITVISSDRSVQKGARTRGAKVADAPAFGKQLTAQREAARPPEQESPGKEGGVGPREAEEWKKRFGIEDDLVDLG